MSLLRVLLSTSADLSDLYLHNYMLTSEGNLTLTFHGSTNCNNQCFIVSEIKENLKRTPSLFLSSSLSHSFTHSYSSSVEKHFCSQELMKDFRLKLYFSS